MSVKHQWSFRQTSSWRHVDKGKKFPKVPTANWKCASTMLTSSDIQSDSGVTREKWSSCFWNHKPIKNIPRLNAGPRIEWKQWSGRCESSTNGLLDQIQTITENICNTVSKFAIKICKKHNLEALETYTAIRTIVVDYDGRGAVTLFRTGEVLRRVIGKRFSKLLKSDLCKVSVQQTCGRQEGGIEAAIHTTAKIYGLPSTKCMLQIDASNALNNMNRELSLHDAQLFCPRIHCYLMNTYQKAARLFIGRGMELQSQESTTQRDNIAIAYYAIDMKPLMYAIDMKPLIDRLEGENIVQEWFAHDAACLGELSPVKSPVEKWWDQMNDFGPKYGYFPKASKYWLICKSEQIATEGKRNYENTGIYYTQRAQKNLGTVIGEIESCRKVAED